MHKKILVLLTGAIALSISAVPVLASDPPTDEGQYIWQDENGDYWYRNGSEDEYIGEGNYAPDPDSGELMEGNDAGWTEQDGWLYYTQEGSDAVAPGAEVVLFDGVKLAEEAGNPYQNSTVTITVQAQAVQVKNNPGTDALTAQGWPEADAE